MNKKLLIPQMPPVFQEGYAVFVKLWELSSLVSADIACSLFDTLDRILLSLNGGFEEKWFPSPYGGAIVVSDVETALKAARTVVQRTAAVGIPVSVGIAFGRFERVLNVTRWNTAAFAMNIAARMASNPTSKRRVVVQPKVRDDATLAKKEFATIFGPKETALVKTTSFDYYLVNDANYMQQITIEHQGRTTRSRTRSADVVLFDIEKYSDKPQEEQVRLVDALSKCVEVALGSSEPSHFGPAGDGGYLAFVAKTGTSAQTAWSFAKTLREQTNRAEIPIRIGIANGPILSTKTRPIVGGVVLLADLVSSEALGGDIAVTKEFWDRLASQLKVGSEVGSKTASGFLAINDASRPGLRNSSENQIPEVSKFEIEMYWGYRPAAHDDLKQTILKCRSKLFIAGLGVTTIANVLNDPHVIDVLANHISKHPEFERTIVTFTRTDNPRVNEQGGKELKDKIKSGRNALRKFYKSLDERVPKSIVRPLIDFRSYDEASIPRHFILQADDVIYVGSYLSHQQGAYSYLIKIRNRADGLYNLFSNEIDYITRHTVPQIIDEDP